ncbi:MAG: hypothetical protein HY692_00730, partial [Cyanobacteria bacterium NC_groundwater_1444_Ag_S-0.65um_54_12]|nr:hypothetical protein [Cyanobacteria bacterium NC_groundwater_1444_Ag_S-0.65um_54_12]
LGLSGTETYDLLGIRPLLTPQQTLSLVIYRNNGDTLTVPLTVRIDTPIEAEYYRHGGILPFMLRQLFKPTKSRS